MPGAPAQTHKSHESDRAARRALVQNLAGGYLSLSVFHCRRVVCACSAGAVGSFSNKPLSPKNGNTEYPMLALISHVNARSHSDRSPATTQSLATEPALGALPRLERLVLHNNASIGEGWGEGKGEGEGEAEA